LAAKSKERVTKELERPLNFSATHNEYTLSAANRTQRLIPHSDIPIQNPHRLFHRGEAFEAAQEAVFGQGAHAAGAGSGN